MTDAFIQFCNSAAFSIKNNTERHYQNPAQKSSFHRMTWFWEQVYKSQAGLNCFVLNQNPGLLQPMQLASFLNQADPDQTRLEQLIVLSNLESINAVLLRQGSDQ